MVRVPLVATFLFASLSAGTLPAQRPLQRDVYADPAGQFAVRIPDGWNAVPQQGSVTIKHGSAYVVISRMARVNDTREIVATLSRQIASQWTNVSTVGRGDISIGGQPAAYEMLSGTSPNGVPSLLRIAGVLAPDGEGFAVLGSSSQREFENVKGALISIDENLTFVGGASNRGGSDRGQRPRN